VCSKTSSITRGARRSPSPPDALARVLVTGGAGFVGSHVADAFLGRGDEVLVVDNLATGSEENIPRGAGFARIDIVDASGLEQAFTFEPQIVCHLAAQASVTVSVEKPKLDCSVNVVGTLNVCESARKSGAPVVFASTGGALYGDGAPLPTPEDSQARPLSPYGASKLAGEAYVSTWARLYGIPNVVLRLGNVYGPRQNPHGEAGVVAIFSSLLLDGGRPQLRGEGRPTRDYVYVADVAAAFVAAAAGGEAGTFNVGTGRQTSTARLLEILEVAAGVAVEPEQVELQPGELQSSALDSSRIQRELGWRPSVEIEDGLAKTLAWYRASRP
jgi:UDP-glucose 4-epimerase